MLILTLNFTQILNDKLLVELSDTAVEPPHLRNARFVENGLASQGVFWFHDGKFYGANAGTAIRVSDDAENWEALTSSPYEEGAMGERIEILLVSETGRVIVGYFNGKVYVSDEDGVFPDEPAFVTSKFSRRRGHFVYRNIIGICTYDTHGMENKHEFWLSTDNGETFELVFDNSNVEGTLLDPDRFHFHDCEYDPYSGRIMIWGGDFENRNLWYSDDWGVTWNRTWETFSPGNATQVIATTKGIMLGSDTDPGGFASLTVNRRNKINPIIDSDTYDSHYWHFNPNRYIAARRWVERDKGIYIVPFYSEHDDGVGHLASSRDGNTWHEIYKTRSIGFHHGFVSVSYGNGKVVASYMETPTNIKTFIADINI